jgi:hypothetical protein
MCDINLHCNNYNVINFMTYFYHVVCSNGHVDTNTQLYIAERHDLFELMSLKSM